IPGSAGRAPRCQASTSSRAGPTASRSAPSAPSPTPWRRGSSPPRWPPGSCTAGAPAGARTWTSRRWRRRHGRCRHGCSTTSATASAAPPPPGTGGRAPRWARTTTTCCASSSGSPMSRSTHSPPRGRSTNNLAMPTTYGPEVLGPPPRPHDQKLWDPEMQAMDPEKRRRPQDTRLNEMVRRVFENPVALFKRKLTSAGIKGPDDIKGVDDLEHVPLTVKQDLREAEAAVPPFGDYRFTSAHDCVRLGTSTGTTGTPTITLWTRNDIWLEYESAARNWWRMGYRPGMIATHAHPAYLYGGGIMLSGAYEYFGLLNVW